MTHKERMIAAIQGNPTDKIPFAPRLDLLLTSDRRYHIACALVVHELRNVVLLGKRATETLFMLVGSPLQVVGYAGIQRPTVAGHDVNVIFCHGGPPPQIPRPRAASSE